MIERIDSPNIIRVRLTLDSSWSSNDVYVACLADSKQVHVKVLPNLLFLQALAHGKGIRSERPIVVEIPYDQLKKDASEQLNKTVLAPIEPDNTNIPHHEEPRGEEPVGVEPITEDDIPF